MNDTPAKRMDEEVDLKYKITQILREGTGMNELFASMFAEVIVDGLTLRHGAHRVYIPAPGKVSRDESIRREFNGRNRREVCEKSGISRAQLYRIVGKKRGALKK